MSSDKNSGPGTKRPLVAKGADETPAWADGLKQLYDDVVEEPIPDSFKDLLDKLDAGGKAGEDGA